MLNAPPKIPFTQEGHQKLQQDLKNYNLKREQVLIRLQTAREMGDLSENAAYKAARFELGSIDRELRRLKFLLTHGVVTPPTHTGIVGFGSRVTLANSSNKLSFTLVSKYESDPTNHQLSFDSPIGQQVSGKKAGDTITVTAPAGETTYRIVTVE